MVHALSQADCTKMCARSTQLSHYFCLFFRKKSHCSHMEYL